MNHLTYLLHRHSTALNLSHHGLMLTQLSVEHTAQQLMPRDGDTESLRSLQSNITETAADFRVYVNCHSHQKLLVSRDTARRSLHTLRSDYHNIGVANDLENPLRPTHAFLRSAPLERPCIASISTSIAIMRQHGGRGARLTRLNEHQARRPDSAPKFGPVAVVRHLAECKGGTPK